MVSFVKEHPIAGGLLLSLGAVKMMHNSRWYSHLHANINLAKTIVNSTIGPEKEIAKLRKYIRWNEMKFSIVKNLSRCSFLPILIAMTACHLDNQWKNSCPSKQ